MNCLRSLYSVQTRKIESRSFCTPWHRVGKPLFRASNQPLFGSAIYYCKQNKELARAGDSSVSNPLHFPAKMSDDKDILPSPLITATETLSKVALKLVEQSAVSSDCAEIAYKITFCLLVYNAVFPLYLCKPAYLNARLGKDWAIHPIFCNSWTNHLLSYRICSSP